MVLQPEEGSTLVTALFRLLIIALFKIMFLKYVVEVFIVQRTVLLC